jgi:uncharacterized protein YndB with AHSA1/START domain
MNTQTLSFTQTVKAPPAEVYRTFTNATALREWLSDAAMAVPHPGGRFYVSWNTGYYASGEYTVTQPGEKVAFTWQGRGEPASTQVHVNLDAQEGGTKINLEHTGLGTGDEWTQAYQEIEAGWRNGLENLASVLENGADLRLVRRPMLGVLLDSFDSDIAKEIGVPVTEGVRLDGVIDGMGAQAAGLQKGDVIVSVAGIPVMDFNSLSVVLQKHYAGDELEVAFYRGAEKMTTIMKLSGRPIPEIPSSGDELARATQKIYDEVDARLDQFLEGVTEEEASHKPAPSEWSIKENIAHLINGERYNPFYIAELAFSEERFSDGFGDNFHPQVEATVAAYPTLVELREELRRNSAETIGTLARLPQEFIARKGSYWRLAYNLLQPAYHLDSHIGQMQAALDSARAKETAGAR